MRKKKALTLIIIILFMLNACTSKAISSGGNNNITTSGGAAIISNLATVKNLEIVILETFPVQIHVLVNGFVQDECTTIGDISRVREGSVFKIIIPVVRPADKICTKSRSGKPFTQTIPLDVYNLEAGIYTVDVNGVRGTFTLTTDNKP